MCEILKNCGSVVVVCEYNGSEEDVYGIFEVRKYVLVVCEYNGR